MQRRMGKYFLCLIPHYATSHTILQCFIHMQYTNTFFIGLMYYLLQANHQVYLNAKIIFF